MKSLATITLLVFSCQFLAAQVDFVGEADSTESAKSQQGKPKDLKQLIGLGVSVGINNQIGVMGLQACIAPIEQLILEAGIGFGTWGLKSTLNAQYLPNGQKGLFLKAGFSSSSGVSNIDLAVDNTFGLSTVNLDLFVVPNLNVGLGYSTLLGKSKFARWYIEGGYSARLRSVQNSYRINSPGVELTDLGEFQMQISHPGGIYLATGFMISVAKN